MPSHNVQDTYSILQSAHQSRDGIEALLKCCSTKGQQLLPKLSQKNKVSIKNYGFWKPMNFDNNMNKQLRSFVGSQFSGSAPAWAYLVNLSITTMITQFPQKMGKAVMNSMVRSSQTWSRIGRSCNSPLGLVVQYSKFDRSHILKQRL